MISGGPSRRPLGRREPQPPPPGHHIRRSCVSEAYGHRNVQRCDRQPDGAGDHLPSRFSSGSSRIPTFLDETEQSDRCGHRMRLSSLPGLSPITTPPPIPQILGSSGSVPTVVAPSGPKLVPSGRTGPEANGHQPRITWRPRPRILENLSPFPFALWRTLHK